MEYKAERMVTIPQFDILIKPIYQLTFLKFSHVRSRRVPVLKVVSMMRVMLVEVRITFN